MSDAALRGAGRFLSAHQEWLYGLVVTLVGAGILVATPFMTNDESALIPLENPALLPSFYPRVVGTLITVTGAWILLRFAVKRLALRGEVLAEQPEEEAGPATASVPVLETPATWRTPALVAAMAVYVVGVNVVGFRGATIVFGIGVSRWIGAPWWAAVLIGIVPAIGLFALFVLGLEVPLPRDLY